ncbi:hypothetical protein XH80_37970 [Bradyrhizobium sp. CCBAU 45384]|nr:hypothetical protein [Bradyrhizobium sp. CCBAU 45384]
MNLRSIDCESKPWPAGEQCLERAGCLDTRELMAKAEMNTRPERHVPVRLAFQIQALRLLVHRRIHIRGGEHHHDAIALLQRHSRKLDVSTHVAWLRKLHRGDEAQKLLDGERGAAPVLFHPVPQSRIPEQLVDRAADQMRGGLRARRQQQEHHRYHFVRRDLAALAFDLDQFGNQALAAPLARDLQLFLEVSPHLAEREQQAKEADDVRQ